MIQVNCDVYIYEFDGEAVDNPISPTSARLHVSSHWNNCDRINLVIGATGQKITVIADDLIDAIRNATNTNR